MHSCNLYINKYTFIANAYSEILLMGAQNQRMLETLTRLDTGLTSLNIHGFPYHL
jgi:hypothetical protein